MMQKILVEVDYRDYYFDYIKEAVTFAETAAIHAEDDMHVSLTIKFTKEESAENGED